MTTARANQTTGLTNGRVANWAPEVEFIPVLLLNQPNVEKQRTFDHFY